MRGLGLSLMTGSFASTVAPDRRRHFRHDIAQVLSVPPGRLLLRPAYHPLLDHASHGRIVRHLYVATQVPAPVRSRDTRPPICLLDLGPLLLGFTWYSAPQGVLQHEPLLDRFSPRCPDGYVLGSPGGRTTHRHCWSRCVSRMETQSRFISLSRRPRTCPVRRGIRQGIRREMGTGLMLMVRLMVLARGAADPKPSNSRGGESTRERDAGTGGSHQRTPSGSYMFGADSSRSAVWHRGSYVHFRPCG